MPVPQRAVTIAETAEEPWQEAQPKRRKKEGKGSGQNNRTQPVSAPASTASSQGPANPPEAREPTKVMIQAMIGTATVSREARMHGLGKSPAPALKQAVRKASGVSQPATTVVLRFVADAKYLAEDEWKAINNKPAASIRAWAAAHAATHTLALKDMWSFRVVGDKDSPRAFLSGLARVQKDAASIFTALSGRDRWFVEQPGAKTPVSWIKRNQSEAAKDFLDRVYAQAKGRGVASV